MKKIKYILYLLIIVITLIQPLMTVHAAGAIGETDKFDNLSGDAQYLGEAYWENYYLDMEELDLLDSGYNLLNGMANALFTFCKWLAYLTVTIFYLCFDLNLADLFGTQINTIQQSLNDSIFSPLFLLGCFFAFCVLAGRAIKQDLAGVIGQLLKIVFIVMLSILVVKKSDVLLSACNNITKEVSIEILSGMNSANGMSANISDFAAQGAGVLWRNLIHEPWMTLQFNNDASITANDVKLFLSLEGGSEARENLVNGYDLACFKKERASARIGFMILYLIPFLLKCGVYILVALVQLVFQLLAILFTFLAPLVLIVSMIPGYEGVLESWFRKILESQISILIISLIIGILIKFDELIFNWARVNNYGWLIALVLQTAMAIALFLNRNKLLTMMSDVQKGVSNPAYIKNRMRQTGNIYQAVPGVTKEAKVLAGQVGGVVRKTGGMVKDVRNNIAESMSEMNQPVSWTVNPFLRRNRTSEDNFESEVAVEQEERRNTNRSQRRNVNSGSTVEQQTEDRQPNQRVASFVSSGEENNPTHENAKTDAMREIADEISRSISHLAEVIEEAEDSLGEAGGKGRHENSDANRPKLMDGKKESGKKDKKEIVITVKENEKDGTTKRQNSNVTQFEPARPRMELQRESASEKVRKSEGNERKKHKTEAVAVVKSVKEQ